MASKSSLCWDCKNAVCGCCWSTNFTPVPGWDAKKKIIKQKGYKSLITFVVKNCPEFFPDKVRITNKALAKLLGVSTRTIFRYSDKVLQQKLINKGFSLEIDYGSKERQLFIERLTEIEADYT